jgi:3-oxoacyl-ACP reductase-like protein
MAVARHLAKPIQSRLESLVLQSAFYGLALAYLPKTYDYIPFEYSSQAELVIPIVRSILQLSWALAVGKRLSSVASHVALNSLKGNVWTDDEIVVVTGGSSGIGAMVVSGFVERGAKVAILDLQESKDTLGRL